MERSQSHSGWLQALSKRSSSAVTADAPNVSRQVIKDEMLLAEDTCDTGSG